MTRITIALIPILLLCLNTNAKPNKIQDVIAQQNQQFNQKLLNTDHGRLNIETQKINRRPAPATLRNLTLGIDIGYSFGPDVDPELEQEVVAADFEQAGDDAEFYHGFIGLDLRYYFGRFGNMTSRRPPFFIGLWGHYKFGDREKGLNLDLHPGAGVDTTYTVEEKTALMPYFGFRLFSLNSVDLAILFGVGFEFAEVIGTSDETGSGGVRERFKDSEIIYTATVGLEASMPLNLANNMQWLSEVFFGFALDYFPNTRVASRSNLGFNYDFDANDDIIPRLYIGLRI